MARYIDANKLIEVYERAIKEEWNKITAPPSWSAAWECVIEDIEEQPTADVAEVKHGYNKTSMHPVDEFWCSECGFCCADYTETNLWARFVLDTENYDMHIMSDCGNYGYGWCPTPEHESFLKLMSRINSDYLLDKIATRGTIDTDETYENIKYLLEQCADEELEDIGIDLEDIETACNDNSVEGIVHGVRAEIRFTPLDTHIEDYELYENISMDYSASQKKIAEVFENHIQPFIKEMLKTDTR